MLHDEVGQTKMTTIAHYIKIFTLWEFVKAHWLTATRHAELVSPLVTDVPASYFWSAGKSKTLKRVQGDVVGIAQGDELRGVNA